MAEPDPMRWVWRGVVGATLLFGWLFILWQNKFHIDPPVVVIMLGFFAVVMTITNLWRVGAAAVAPDEYDRDSWGRPLGERGELEKEKRTLLKSIKEAEFDQAMGKLSKGDAEQLIGMYRARAIEVIKALDDIDTGTAGTLRERIEREVAARIALEEKTKDKAEKAAEKKKAKGDKGAKKSGSSSEKFDSAKSGSSSEKSDSAKSGSSSEKSDSAKSGSSRSHSAKSGSSEQPESAKSDAETDAKSGSPSEQPASAKSAETDSGTTSASEATSDSKTKSDDETSSSAADHDGEPGDGDDKVDAAEAISSNAEAASESAPRAKEASS